MATAVRRSAPSFAIACAILAVALVGYFGQQLPFTPF